MLPVGATRRVAPTQSPLPSFNTPEGVEGFSSEVAALEAGVSPRTRRNFVSIPRRVLRGFRERRWTKSSLFGWPWRGSRFNTPEGVEGFSRWRSSRPRPNY